MSHEIKRTGLESVVSKSPLCSNERISNISSSHTYDLKNLRILCVDDSEYMHKILKTILSAMNIKTLKFCDDPTDAYSLMQTWLPDILVADLVMPGLDGLELVRRLRQASDSPDPFMPIIVISANTDTFHVLAARDAGANEIVAKPVSIATLYGRLVRLIESPAPFIKSKGYVGPDRRRFQRPYDGQERRSQDDVPTD